MRIEVKGETLDEAINNAMIELSITSENLKYEIKQGGNTGFLGIGSKPFIIEAYDKNDKEEIYKEKTVEKKEKLVKDEKGVYEFHQDKKNINLLSKEEQEEVFKIATNFLTPIFDGFGAEIKIEYELDEKLNNITLNLSGEKMGVVIGKHGQTLDALQHLTNIIVNNEMKEKIKIRIDSENYRDKRYKKIENLARNVAQNVKKTKKDYELEPMSSYDRRIIHSILQKERNIETVSVGEDKDRRVIVKYKRS